MLEDIFGEISEAKPIGHLGPILVGDIGEDKEFILAVIADDRIVKIEIAMKMSVGCPVAGTSRSTTIFWNNVRKGPDGLHALLEAIPEVVKKATEKRKIARLPFKQFYKKYSNLDCQLFFEVVEESDTELFDEIQDLGIEAWMEERKN